MSIVPIITFKAGQCDVDESSSPYKVKPNAKQGYIYLYSEDDLIHFCWRERSAPMDQPELDLVMFPTDCHFEPYEYKTSEQPTSKTNGRIFVLKFSSSSQRHLFWLQSKSQSPSGDPSWFSPRDLKIGQIVDKLFQGEEVDVASEIAQIHSGDRDNDDDETMEDVEGHGEPDAHGGGGGAGPAATGGDIREEGAESREGGADGGRAAPPGSSEANIAVQNFLNSLKGSQGFGSNQQLQSKTYTTLPELLPPSTTTRIIDSAAPAEVDNLLSYLPPTLLEESSGSTPSTEERKALLKRVLHSPQFQQSLSSLTSALRDGGLPTIADALGVRLANGGLVPGGSVPLGGGDAVEAFVEGIKKAVEEE